MHYSRLAGFIIDCRTEDLDGAARFWSAALGMAPLEREPTYQPLDSSARDLVIEVQQVAHESRLHLDLETDDVEAEAARLEALGATRVKKIRTFWVMQSPTGQRFCVVRARHPLEGRPGANRWP
jgi:catechol 2,3-dioxygenase-like lactoylglutathione lyase family enzyme